MSNIYPPNIIPQPPTTEQGTVPAQVPAVFIPGTGGQGPNWTSAQAAYLAALTASQSLGSNYTQTWLQSDWYVDFVNGNDANSGSSPAQAVKTVMGGVVAKWGTMSPILRQSTTLHILTSQPVGAEAITLQPVMAGPFMFVIQGTPQAHGAAFALGAVTAKNRATGAQFAAAGLAASTAGQLLVNTTHASRYLFFHNTAVDLDCIFDTGLLYAGIALGGGICATANTGTKYAAGVWTDGVAVTAANIDTNGGLQNPKTGAKFAVN